MPDDDYAVSIAHLLAEVSRLSARVTALEQAAGIASSEPVRGTRQTSKSELAEPDTEQPLTYEQENLFARLKKWRYEKAKEANVPAYVISPNKHLEALCREHPTSIEALDAVKGSGPRFVEQYGQEVLILLRGQSTPAGDRDATV